MTTFRGMEVWRESDKHILCYSRYDLGDKYKIYIKDENGNKVYNISFAEPIKAINYYNKLHA